MSSLIHYKQYFEPTNANPYFQFYGIKVIAGSYYNSYFSDAPSIGGGKVIIKGIPSAPISLSFGANYSTGAFDSLITGMKSGVQSLISPLSTKFQSNASPIGEAVNNFGANVGASLGGHILKQVTGIGNTTVQDTILEYVNSDIPGVSFEITLFKEYITETYKQIINRCLKMISPKLNGAMIVSPGKYNSSIRDIISTSGIRNPITMKNTYTIKIGKILMITHQLPTNFDFSYSPALDEEGEPLYIKIRLSFRAARILDIKEIQKWFKFK